ncbi:MAG TPA: hypothetical protein DCM86_06350, partial [Verrucomicrobiales bacterium]|nr:hypothetical protein [Verrucomicrobiales bacterium]
MARGECAPLADPVSRMQLAETTMNLRSFLKPLRSSGRRASSLVPASTLAVAVAACLAGVGSLFGGASDERGGTLVEARAPSETNLDAEEFFRQGQFAESTKDWVAAAKYYRRAARLGHAPSQNNLGFLL